MPTQKTDIHVGDLGTTMRVIAKEDEKIIPITSGSIIFRNADEERIIKQGTLTTDGSDGALEYLSEEGFFDGAGTWYISAIFIGTGGRWTGTAIPFTVMDEFDIP